MSADLHRKVLESAKADSIPKGESGLWSVKKWGFSKPLGVDGVMIPAGQYTGLFRFTDATIHLGVGELVMHDYLHELQTHLDFMLRARGKVLVTGLGLGCVARGLLANPAVKSVLVIERSVDVIDLVWPHMTKDRRLKLELADALKWVRRTRTRFDSAWHDLWSDKDEPHLQVNHMELICRMAKRVNLQGAWKFPRHYRRLMRHEAKVI